MSSKSHRLVTVLAVVVGCSTTTTTPAAPPTVPASPPTPAVTAGETVSGFARVAEGARLFVAPSENADAVVLRPHHPTAEGFAPSVVVRAVAASGGFVEVRPVAAREIRGRCGPGLAGLEAYDLRLYVKRDNLQRVVEATKSMDAGDGTKITLRAGAPVARTDPTVGPVAVAVGVDRLFARLQPQDIGLFYEPDPPRGPSTAADGLDAGARLSYGKHELVLRQPTRPGSWQLTALTEGDAAVATLVQPCAELVARVRTGARVPAPAGPKPVEGVKPIPDKDAKVHFASAGAKVYWPDGREAGITRGRVRLGTEPKPLGDRTCFATPPLGRDGSSLNVCFDAASVTVAAPPADPAGPTGSGLDGATIRKVVLRDKNKIKYCYERELARNPGLAGKVIVRFHVQADGKVSEAKVTRTTIGNAKVESCLLRHVGQWKFGPIPGGEAVDVSYPFVFGTATP